MSGNWEVFVADPEANSALAAGDLAKASAKFFWLAEDDRGVGIEYFYRAAIPAIWARDLARTKEINATYNETGAYGPVAEARTATLNASIAAMEGRPAEALTLFKDGLRGWRATHTVWDEAVTGISVAELLDPSDPQVAEIVGSTRAILERLGAKPYLDRLDAAVDRAGAPPASSTRSPEAAAPEPTEVAVTE